MIMAHKELFIPNGHDENVQACNRLGLAAKNMGSEAFRSEMGVWNGGGCVA